MSSNRSDSPQFVQSGVDALADGVEASWQGLLTPVLLITAQLLVLVWLVLFLVITDAAEARAPKVALADAAASSPGVHRHLEQVLI